MGFDYEHFTPIVTIVMRNNGYDNVKSFGLMISTSDDPHNRFGSV